MENRKFDESQRNNHGEKATNRYNNRQRAAVGGVLLIAGTLLIFQKLGFLSHEITRYIFCWQTLLITIGVVGIISKRTVQLPSIILILIGGFFLLRNFNILPHDIVYFFWPVALIAAGLIILLRHTAFVSQNRNQNQQMFSNTAQDSENYLKRDFIFGGGKIIMVSENFSGGDISTIFGGCEIDFTQAKLAEGTHVLEMNAVFGGLSILVPREWNVVAEVSGILGGFSDERRYFNTDEIDRSRTLIIRGNAVFGGGELKNI